VLTCAPLESLNGGFCLDRRYRSPANARLRLINRRDRVPECLTLAERGHALRHVDVRQMLSWTEVAAECCPEDADPSIRGRILAYHGNALRAVGSYEQAERILEEASSLLGDSDPQVLEFRASLLRSLRRLDAASECLTRASALRQKSSDAAGLASSFLQTGIVFDLAGRSAEASHVAGAAIDSTSDRILVRIGIQNLALYLSNAGEPESALRIIRHGWPLLQEGGEVTILRVRWLLARISSALKDDSGAKRGYKAVRSEFLARNLYADAAVCSLDLARHLFLRGELEGASAEAATVAPLLAALDISNDAFEALLLKSIIDRSCEDIEEALLRLIGLLADRCTAAAAKSPRHSS
jgi:tetratricopeptide (TPR) repeat protein